MFWFLFSFIILLFSLHYFLNCNKEALEIRRIPGPPETFLVGNALDILVSPIQLFNIGRKWANEYKDLYRFWAIGIPSINIYKPEDVEVILSNTVHNEKSVIYSFIKPWLQDGLLLSGGQKWHNRRKILTPAFHFNILRHFSVIIEENCSKLVQRLEMELDKSKTNVVPVMSEFTLNSICETAMGVQLDKITTDAGKKYKNYIYDIGGTICQRLTRVLLQPDWIFNLSVTGRKQNKIIKGIREFTTDVINNRRKFINEHGITIQDDFNNEDDEYFKNKKYKLAMLDLLLQTEKDGLIDKKGIQEEVDTFMFEGHDTTAQALVFAVMLLANHKNIQDKAVEELNEIFGDSDRSVSMQDMSCMKYLECCIKETMRLYPPVFFISRVLGETVKLSNYVVPAGLACNIHIYDLHRRSELFPEPLKFNPERFTTENSIGRHPYAYIPFSAGPRNCIGQRFAMIEMKLALAAILRKFELRPVTKPHDLQMISDMVLKTRHPIYVSFVKRRKTE